MFYKRFSSYVSKLHAILSMSASYIETIYRDGIKELFRLEQNFIPLWSEAKKEHKFDLLNCTSWSMSKILKPAAYLEQNRVPEGKHTVPVLAEYKCIFFLLD